MFNYFDKIAEKYDIWYQTKVGKYIDNTEKDLIFSLLKTKKGIVLDLGCGTGNYTLELYKKNFKVIGLDLSKEMLKIAKRKISSIFFVKANAYKLPFKNEIFDLVLSITMFEFLKKPEIALKEIYRVLKPGGEFIIGTMNDKSLWFFFKRLKSLFVETAYRYAKFYSIKELQKMCLSAGFTQIETRGIIYVPSFFPWLRFAEKLDKKFANTILKNIGAFVVVRGYKPG